MRAVGKLGHGVVVCFAASFALWAIPVGPSYAEVPASAPAAAACPPSQAVLAGSTAPSPAPAVVPSPLSADMSPYQPSSEEVVACVGSQEINGATFAHWVAIAESSLPPSRRRQGAEPTRAEMTTTMGFLISVDWVMGEAANLHIEASALEVRRRFDRLQREQFPKRTQFERFLKQSGQTVGDLLLRVRLNMLTSRIQRLVEGGGSRHARRRALARFVKRFHRTWETQTYCETTFKVSDCGHTASSL